MEGLSEEHDVVEVAHFSSVSVEKAVTCSPADFFGDAKRLSGRMCSKLVNDHNKNDQNKKHSTETMSSRY